MLALGILQKYTEAHGPQFLSPLFSPLPPLQFVTKKNRILVYQYLFREGTLVAKKDPYLEKHSEALPIPNLEVMKLLQSFKSKGFVKETFNWQYYYYYLTNEGVTYLREYLALPSGSFSPSPLASRKPHNRSLPLPPYPSPPSIHRHCARHAEADGRDAAHDLCS